MYAAADFMSNALQFLDLRSVYGGGFGYHAIKSDNTTLDLLGGVNYTHEVYSNGNLIPGSVPPAFESYGQTNKFVALTLGRRAYAQGGEEHGHHAELCISFRTCRTPANTA